MNGINRIFRRDDRMMTGLTGFLFLGKEKKANGAGGPWLRNIEQPGIGALRVGLVLRFWVAWA